MDISRLALLTAAQTFGNAQSSPSSFSSPFLPVPRWPSHTPWNGKKKKKQIWIYSSSDQLKSVLTQSSFLHLQSQVQQVLYCACRMVTLLFHMGLLHLFPHICKFGILFSPSKVILQTIKLENIPTQRWRAESNQRKFLCTDGEMSPVNVLLFRPHPFLEGGF